MNPIVTFVVGTISRYEYGNNGRRSAKRFPSEKGRFSLVEKSDNILLKSIKHEEIEPSLHVSTLVVQIRNSYSNDTLPISVTLPTVTFIPSCEKSV